MTTGERMKRRRKELGLSGEKVAEALGVSNATIYRYEKGDIEKVPGDLLAKLAEVLRTTPAYLMGWEDVPPAVETFQPTQAEVTMLKKYRALSQPLQDVVAEMIDREYEKISPASNTLSGAG